MLHGRLLRYLDEIVKAGSIRKAAERLHVASSAINRQVLALERELGAPIFERLPRRLRLTAVGEMLLVHVRQTLKDHRHLRARIEALRGMQSGEASIAALSTLATGPLLDAFRQLRQRQPFLKVSVQVLPLEQIVAAVLNGEADLGLAYNMPDNPRLQVLASHEKLLGAAMAPDHPLATQLQLRLSDCLAYPLAIPQASVSIRPLLEAALPSKAELSPAIEVNSIEMLRQVARIAPHLTFLNELDVEAETAEGTLVLLPVRELARFSQTLALVCRAGGVLTRAAGALAQEIQDALERTRPPE